MRHLPTALLITLLAMTACATEAIRIGQVVPWEERQLKTTIPAPFGVVKISIATDKSGKTTAFDIKTDAGQLALPEDILAQLSDVSEPQVTYKKDEKEDSSEIGTFSVHVEFGELVYSEKYQESFKKIAGWSMDKSMTLKDFEVVNFQ